MKKNTKIKILKRRKNEYSAEITLEDGSKFYAKAHGVEDYIDGFNQFYHIGTLKPEIHSRPLLYKDIQWGLSFKDEDGHMGSTERGSKVAIELFAALMKFFTDWLDKYDPAMIVFVTTGEPSKTKLYKTLYDKFIKSGKYAGKHDNEEFTLLNRKFLV